MSSNPEFTLWLTGRSGAGKTTLAVRLADYLRRGGYPVEILDGDYIRGFVKNQDFSPEGRERHLMYVGLTSRLLNLHGVITICAFVSPYDRIREELRKIIPNFHLIHTRCSLEEAIKRDVKGLYSKKIPGIDVFEEPRRPDLIVDTETQEVDQSLNALKHYLGRIMSISPGEPIPEESCQQS